MRFLLLLFSRSSIFSGWRRLLLTPLLVALARTPLAWQRFIMGWAAGIFYWFFLCTWIQFVLEVHGGMGRWGGWASFALFAVLKGLHLAVFSWLAGHADEPRLCAAGGGGALDRPRTHPCDLRVHVARFGECRDRMSLPLRLAPFVGVYGLSFVFAMLSVGAGVCDSCAARAGNWLRCWRCRCYGCCPPFPKTSEPRSEP